MWRGECQGDVMCALVKLVFQCFSDKCYGVVGEAMVCACVRLCEGDEAVDGDGCAVGWFLLRSGGVRLRPQVRFRASERH